MHGDIAFSALAWSKVDVCSKSAEIKGSSLVNVLPFHTIVVLRYPS